MPDHTKEAIRLYKPLIDFANAEIAKGNWDEVLLKLHGVPVREGEPVVFLSPSQWQQYLQEYRSSRRRVAPLKFNGKPVCEPKPLQTVQRELREDLDRLTDPARDIQPPQVPTRFPPGLSPTQQAVLHQRARAVRQGPLKDLLWLYRKLTGVRMEAVMQLRLRKENLCDRRLLLTDRVSLDPHVDDLRMWTYFCLAKLWADGLLPRLGRCKKCQRFFLAPTQKKKIYCSQRCAQSVTGAARARESREHWAKWEKAKEVLVQLLADMDAIARKQKLQRPRSEREILGESEKALKRAQDAFAPFSKKRQGYEEGKAFLASAEKQVLKLRKRVRGY